jgi:hypothetical protein
MIDSIFLKCLVRKVESDIIAGGAIYAFVEAGGTFLVEDNRVGDNDATFIDCELREGYGGAIAIYGNSDVSGIIFSGERLSFSGCFSTYGNHLFIGSNNFPDIYNKITFNYHYDLSDINNIIGATWTDTQPQIIPIYNYLCERTKKEYIWITDKNTCVDYAKCHDICSTGTTGIKNKIYNHYNLYEKSNVYVYYYYYYNNILFFMCLHLALSSTCGTDCYFVENSDYFNLGPPDFDFCSEYCPSFYTKDEDLKSCTLSCESRTPFPENKSFRCGYKFVHINYIYIFIYFCANYFFILYLHMYVFFNIDVITMSLRTNV